VYTAERSAYRNLTLNIRPPDTAQALNPGRELVGARIRADIYGLVAPGKPQLAAELAYRDAALSHTKNGVYSAMFVAAMLAWSFVTHDAREIVQVGLSEIPARSRLAEAIRAVLALRDAEEDWESAYERLLLQLGSYHPVHAINNTAWVALALLYSEAAFDRAICMAVTCGLDTDCNVANVGAIAGLLQGASGIAERWTAPLHDTLYTTVAQWRERRISALAQRTAQLAIRTLSTT
jgi:ADP-ribosylglycohydrolase